MTGRAERFNPDMAGRPVLISRELPAALRRHGAADRELGRHHQEQVARGHGADHRAGGGANGVIIAQGGSFGGWSLYANDGRPAYCYNLLGIQRFKVYGEAAIPAGEHQVRMEFAYDGGGLGKGGTVSLYLDGDKIGEGRVADDPGHDLLG